MNAVEKTLNRQTEQSVTRADLSLMLSRLTPKESLEFLESEIKSHPLVALSTIITDDELHNYYVTGNREL